MSKMSRRLVVDSSIMHSASEKDHPESSSCRAFLDEMLSICHRLVISAAIVDEWKRHLSGYSLLWLGAMRRKRKDFVVQPVRNDELERAIAAGDFSDAEKEALRKDLLLIQAAFEADRAVASLDERARRLFGRLAGEATALRSLVWVNPVLAEDKSLAWLQAGARLEADRRLYPG
jgi:predicted nucleic acid-binding protein